MWKIANIFNVDYQQIPENKHNMELKKRLLEFIQKKGIKIAAFERETGLSEGYVHKMKSLGSDILLKIEEEYPDINLDWLITGNGEMFLTSIENRIHEYIEYRDAGDEITSSVEHDEVAKQIELEKAVRTSKDKLASPEYNLAEWALTKYPELNKEWLLTGKGQILRAQTIDSVESRFQEYLERSGESKEDALEISLQIRDYSQHQSYFSKNSVYNTAERRYVERVLRLYPDISKEWLMHGEGEMFKAAESTIIVHNKDIAITPLDRELSGGADFIIKVNDSKLQPKYKKGDTVACKEITKW